MSPKSASAMPSPRIFLIYKGRGINSWHEDIQSGFRQLGCEVKASSLRSNHLIERISQVRTKTRLLENDAVCRRIAASLREFGPDLILVLNFPGLPEQAHSMFREATDGRTPIVGWLCDRFDRFPPALRPLFDGVYNFDTAASDLLMDIYQGTSCKLRILPLAANPDKYRYAPIHARSRIAALAFAGNCTPSRNEIFERYRKIGGGLETFGPHSTSWLRPWRNRRLSSDALSRIYKKYLVSLNVLQEGNTVHGLNLRAFEIPCAGGLGTYPDVPQLAECFIPGEEILVYHSLEELKSLVEEMIADPEKAQAISEAGHRRVMNEHTFAHRAVTIISDWLPKHSVGMLSALK
ncbi:glycosyltransferase [Luteolibacter algae]|uniref:Glycosyltransferase n=1 Tax=Luteolibacter algae TaxID=454151 RepID=A0ABW5DAL0_9BACT